MKKKEIKHLDTKGYECPIPVLKTKKYIKNLEKNSIIHIESDDKLSEYDFKNFCNENNYNLLSVNKINNIIHIKIKI
ncbi:MAG: hypothetical protein CMI90_03690 [Pelagibacteraceae bacterium]|nr:hypothetical protein [Pelagibacteraceae bacterium]|tara:strand:+ start:290 stop:520 length:231 start_codon:yes stop_codon:yes gene_type:complete